MKLTLNKTTIAVSMPTPAALLQEVRHRLSAGKGFALATINPGHVIRLRRAPACCTACAAQDLVVADGRPILPLARVAAETGTPVALFGSTPESLEKAGQGMCRKVAGLKIVSKISPPFGFDPESPEAGAQRRAPVVMQKLALEWLWRMLDNPRHLVGRYAVCAAILTGAAIRALGQRRAGGHEFVEDK